MQDRITQVEQVINALKTLGGASTLKDLNQTIDFTTWGTKTPEASVRRIVQTNNAFFRIESGLWALESCRDDVMKRFRIHENDIASKEKFTHSYYQGLLLEIGRCRNYTTYVPPQDKHKLFLDRELAELSDHMQIPKFAYDNLLRKAKTVDVVWFNERNMPAHLFEVEHSTDIKNSLNKFYELQDFYAQFYIVANCHRKSEFLDKLNSSIYIPIQRRVKFVSYDEVAARHCNLVASANLSW